MMQQTTATDGAVSVYDHRAGYGLTLFDVPGFDGQRIGGVTLTRDQAADLLASLLSMGVPLNDTARDCLARSA